MWGELSDWVGSLVWAWVMDAHGTGRHTSLEIGWPRDAFEQRRDFVNVFTGGYATQRSTSSWGPLPSLLLLLPLLLLW